MARCPAHDDSSPSLSVRLKPDGRILIHCFAGCSGHDVMTAISMSLSDLYPDGALDHHIRREYRGKAKDTFDETVLEIGESDRAAKKRQSTRDQDDEINAWLRLKGYG